ncbi:MAG: M18 family aminopeptidase [unclassified Hahellaceae]|nr:M18 family aminopeptidase [Hahellaceae bacterium]|tara:strand:- start:11623 stop:12999 length:1377 start_codon:yes stop_codon:yes gene_type:complete
MTEVKSKLESFNKALLKFIDDSPTPFHAVANMQAMLNKAGFRRLDAAADWGSLSAGELDRSYVVRNDSSIVILAHVAALADADAVNRGLRLYGAHTDSPCLKLKPLPALSRHGTGQLGVEIYGGALLNPWFDRDLSMAGRVVVTTSSGERRSLLVDFQRPIATVPSLAIHLDREVNQNRSVNPQKHMPPVILLEQAGSGGFSADGFEQILLEEARKAADDDSLQRVVSWELSLYDTQPGAVIGLESQMIASARLDNLLSCYVGLRAMLDSKSNEPCVLVFNDHEEVGSQSAEGAEGNLLPSTIQRIVAAVRSKKTTEDVSVRCHRLLERSFMVSADNAHAIHPNYADRHDENHGPQLNRGPVIKVNHNQRYATNAVTSAFYEELASRCDLPWQSFVVRSDMACGSTIGPITASALGVKTLDIGMPQWAMHSVRELCGSEDPHNFYTVMKAYFGTKTLP